jgi:hypothetical protein
MAALRMASGLGAIVLAGTVLTGPAAALASAGTADATVAGAGDAAAAPAGAAHAGAAHAGAARHKGILPPHNPAKNLAPDPSFLGSRHCAGGRDGSACNSIVLRAITHARKVLEKFGGMSFSLPAYERLTPDEQLFVTANLERTERGLPAAVVLSRSLDKVAQDGANADTDPPLGKVPNPLPGGGHWVSLGGNWAGGWGNPLGADYGWMYDDGPGWGHRDNILGKLATTSSCGGSRHEVAMGAGHVTKGKTYGDSETELFAGVCGPTPTDAVLTWAKAKKLLHITA